MLCATHYYTRYTIHPIRRQREHEEFFTITKKANLLSDPNNKKNTYPVVNE